MADDHGGLVGDDFEWVVSVMHNPDRTKWCRWRWLVRHPRYGMEWGWRLTRWGAERAAERTIARWHRE